ncbi:MAG: hypothetical protein PHD32_11330 [Eubacteriales bacterium]|nr:hypothetical protein [Eubacteriales bacterium]
MTIQTDLEAYTTLKKLLAELTDLSAELLELDDAPPDEAELPISGCITELCATQQQLADFFAQAQRWEEAACAAMDEAGRISDRALAERYEKYSWLSDFLMQAGVSRPA